MPWILVVDDDRDTREVLAEALSDDGYTVVTHGDGLAALNALSLVLPDLVLLDLRLPAMDGLAFLQWLRRMPRGAAVPVVAMSAAPSWADFDALQQHGVVQFLQKPFDLTDFLGLVEHCVRPAGAEQA